MGLTPALFTSAKPDGADPTKLQPSYWNRVTGLLNSLLNGSETHGSVMYRDTSDLTDAASYAASAAGVLACAGSGQAPAFRALATTDLPAGVALSLFTSTTLASNVGTAETNLITYSMPGNTLAVNGQKVRVTAWGLFSGTASTKTINLYFGATLITAKATTATSVAWRIQYEVIRTGATSQIGNGWNYTGSTLTMNGVGAPTETLSGTVVIKVTGTDSVGSNNVTAYTLFVELIP